MPKMERRKGEEEEAPQAKEEQKEKESPPEESASKAAVKEKPSPAARKRMIENLTKEKEELYDRLLRLQADYENYKKRIDKEKQEFYLHALSEFIREILPTIDDLERALEKSDSKDLESYQQGIELIYNNLRETLQKFGLQPIKAKEEIFDPYYHEALFLEKTDQYPENQILEEYQKGYMLKDRLLRPAVVKVAVKKKEPQAQKPEKEEEQEEPPEGIQ
ncbi:MAG: nucleotide exchange factor GrpE [Acidobacteriota bacterium]